jgi:hypothetical protein
MEQLTADNIRGLLKKYAIVIIILHLLTQYAIGFMLTFYFKTFPIDPLTNLDDLSSMITGVFTLTCNLIVGLIILSDIDRTKSLTWILFGLTLLAPWFSVIFMIAWKVVEMKNSPQQKMYKT